MKESLILIIVVLTCFSSFSQSNLEWTQNFDAKLDNNTSDLYYPRLEKIVDTLIIAGIIKNSEGQSFAKAKYGLSGNLIKQIVYGNDSVSNNRIVDYTFDNNENVYLLHQEYLEYYKSKIVIQKYSELGELIWIQEIMEEADTSFSPYSINVIGDTSICINFYKQYNYPLEFDDAPMTESILMLCTLDSNGNFIWGKNLSKELAINHFSHKLISYGEEVFLLAFTDDYKTRIVRINSNGIIISNNIIEYPKVPNKISQLSDGYLLMSSMTGRFETSKVLINGKKLWSKYYKTNLPDNVYADEVISMTQDNNGNIYVTGRHYGDEYNTSNYTNADLLTVKYDSNGNQVWENRYEHNGNNADIGNVIFISNENIYVGGQSQRQGISTDYDYIVLKIDMESGKTNGSYRFNGAANGDDKITDLKVFNDGKVALTGLSRINNSSYSWTTQLLTDITTSVTETSNTSNIQVFPNPIKKGEKLTIKAHGMKYFVLLNLDGSIVTSGNLSSSYMTEINFDHLQQRMYILNIKSETKMLSKKIIKQ